MPRFVRQLCSYRREPWLEDVVHVGQRAANVSEDRIQFSEGWLHHLPLVQLGENSSSHPGNRKSDTTLSEGGAGVMFNIKD